MHKSSLDKMTEFVKTLDQKQSLKVLDFGSRDINGSYKSMFDNSRWEYLGVDLFPGKNVDMVISDPYKWPIKESSYDIVISGQKLENIEWFWEVMKEIRRVLKPGGLTCIILPSSGPEHKNPIDTYRFYQDGLVAMANWAGLEVIEAKTQSKSKGYEDSSDRWLDSVLIAKKPIETNQKLISIMPLVSRDIHRSIRVVVSAVEQQFTNEYKFVVHPIINSKNEKFVDDFSGWCRANNINHTVTDSNGTPSKGKNEVLKVFRNSIYGGMLMIDGDDVLYPSASRQLEFHLRQFSNVDFLVARGVDHINSEAGKINFGKGTYGNFWSNANYNPKDGDGPGKHRIFTHGKSASCNIGSHIFYSKKLINLISYDEEQLLGEDLLFEFYALKQYVSGNIFFMATTANDFKFLDRTKENDNIQKKYNDNQGMSNFLRLRDIVGKMGEDRTSFNEIPIRYPNLIFSYNEKIEFAKNILNKNFNLDYKILQ